MLRRAYTEAIVATYQPWGEAWSGRAPSAGAWPWPHLDRGLLASGPVSSAFLPFEPLQLLVLRYNSPGKLTDGGAPQQQGSVL